MTPIYRNLRKPAVKLFMRTITESPIASTPRITNAIKNDHRQIESYYSRINTSTDREEQTRYQNLFTWELA